MAARLKPNRLEIVGLVAAVLTTCLCIRGASQAAELYLTARPATAGMKALGLAGWAIATFGPMAVAALFWRLAKRVRARWLVHLLFLACAIAVFRAGDALMLFVTGTPDFDDTLGTPEMQAALMFVVAAAAYLAAILSALPFRQAKRAGE
jgi:hypothetical protein